MGVFLYAGALSTGAITSATAGSVTSTSSTFATNEFQREALRIEESGESRLIVSHTTDTFTVSPDWDSTPTSTETFRVARHLNVAAGSANRDVKEIGDRKRTFDGTLRSTIRSIVSNWTGRTTPLTIADASSVEATLTGSTQPIQIGGTLIDASSLVNADGDVNSVKPIQSSTGNRMIIDFILRESS